MENEGGGGGKMSAPSTSSLSVITVTRVIDVKYGCFTFFATLLYLWTLSVKVKLAIRNQSKVNHS